MLRRSVQKSPSLKTVKELDAFPKIPESYTESTASGGAISILSFLLIILLVVSEIKHYKSTQLEFKYTVDHDFDSKLKINIDITVAMPCDTIGADILDVTNQNTQTFGKLQEEPAYFELTPLQRAHWNTMQNVNTYIREQHHAIQDLLWKEGYTNLLRGLPARETDPTSDPDACRLFGTLVVNKVAGNFHITAGKHIPHPAGHAHLSAFLREQDYNFSHRIERFSFGDSIRGIFDPLEGDEKIAKTNFRMFQYYLKVVPTEVINPSSHVVTYQYSVTEQDRPINHDAGSHGVPGIYFKYDMTSVKVKVIEKYPSFWRFLVRLCGIVGGVYATSGILSGFLKLFVDVVSCNFLKSTTSAEALSSSPAQSLVTKNLNKHTQQIMTVPPVTLTKDYTVTNGPWKFSTGVENSHIPPSGS